jgi:carbon monoxide dehydrogenase subunit G
MQVKLEKKHVLDAPVDAGWNVLRDINALAACMPGASITEETGENQYKGNVSVKVGPVQTVFGGTIDIISLDEANHSLSLSASGKDKSGTSNASMQLTASVSPAEGGGCELVGNSDIKVMGKMANFGSRMITSVADQLIDQFLTNFSNRVWAAGEGEAAAAAARKVAEQPQSLNAFALLWAMIVGFFRRLFRRKGPH